MTAPSSDDCKAYLVSVGQAASWDDNVIAAAYQAEKAAQAKRCRIPDGSDPWPSDLIEALFRRVAHNLALRALPLGVQANLADPAGNVARVGGTDAEVKRLEAPYRKLPLG